MPITEQQTGEKDGQPIMKQIYLCDQCLGYGHAIKTEGSKTTIGCIWKDGEPGCKEAK